MSNTKETIKEGFAAELDKYFGVEKPSCFKVRIIHNDKDICINSSEREILQAIQKQQQQKYGLNWHFSENSFSKALILPFEKLLNTDLNGFEKEYKLFYKERIQMIINKYDNYDLNGDTLKNYKNIKSIYQNMITENCVDFKKYKEVRNMFEGIRNVN